MEGPGTGFLVLCSPCALGDTAAFAQLSCCFCTTNAGLHHCRKILSGCLFDFQIARLTAILGCGRACLVQVTDDTTWNDFRVAVVAVCCTPSCCEVATQASVRRTRILG